MNFLPRFVFVPCLLLSTPAFASDLCSDLASITSGAPTFASLEGGKFNEADFYGTVTLSQAHQCVVRHNYDLNPDYTRGADHISYECEWDSHDAAVVQALRQSVARCYPSASKEADASHPDSGVIFRTSNASIDVDITSYGANLYGVWLTVRGPDWQPE